MRVFEGIAYFFLFFLFANTANAVIYQYFDEDGTLIVTNVPEYSKKPAPPEEQKYRRSVLNFKDDVFYEFYPAIGGTFRQAVMNTQMSGPFEIKDNRRYAAQTKWNLGWSYKLNSSYRVEGAYVYVSVNIFDVEFKSVITVLLPALSEQYVLSENDLALWEQFVQKLLDHEHDHVALIKDPLFRDEAMKKISALRELTIDYVQGMVVDEAIRNAVESQTAKIGHDLIMEIKTRNDEYDRLTEHGMKPDMRSVFFR
jgi:predicted secreted Zn-dependent protease